VYMRASVEAANAPLDEYTLMPTHMKSRFGVGELETWEPAEPFAFTKGLRTMRLSGVRPAAPPWMSAWRHGTLLFDLEADPGQERPMADDDVELRMLRLLARLMHDTDAPATQFERLGIPFDEEPAAEHLLVRTQAERAAAIAEPLPPPSELPALDLLREPVLALLQDTRLRGAIERHAPELARTELLTVGPGVSLVDLARQSILPVAILRAVAADLAARPSQSAQLGERLAGSETP
jgi:hypothetical protein